MGGIGKTVTGAALVRDADVRDHFHQIVWLPLGQTPVMEKLQSSAMEQLVGKPMDSNLSEEERHAALRDAFKGKRVLLALDDLWEEDHPAHLNFVDESCGSRVLISTRIRHLLADAFAVEIGKPSVDDSISILMAAAELGVPCTSRGRCDALSAPSAKPLRSRRVDDNVARGGEKNKKEDRRGKGKGRLCR